MLGLLLGSDIQAFKVYRDVIIYTRVKSKFAHPEKLSLFFEIRCLQSVRVPLWFIIIAFVFFYLRKLLFSGFLQFQGNFVHTQISKFNNSNFRV